MKAQFPVERQITELDLNSSILTKKKPINRFVVGSVVLHILSASAVFMLRPFPQPTPEVIEVELGAGQKGDISAAPLQAPMPEEAAPVAVVAPVMAQPLAPKPKPVVVPVAKVAPVVVAQPESKPEPEPTPSVGDNQVPALAETESANEPLKPEVSAEEIRQQVEEKLATAQEAERLEKENEEKERERQAQAHAAALAAAAEAQAEAEKANAEAAAAVAEATQAGQGTSEQNASPSPLKGELRTLAELKQKPGNPKPSYDALERRQGHNGGVIFKAYVTQDGNLAQFELLQSTGHKNLDLKTLKALKQWKFYPGQEGWVELPFQWDLKGGPQEMPTLLRRRVGQK